MNDTSGCTVQPTEALAIGSPTLPVLLAGLGTVLTTRVIGLVSGRFATKEW